MNADRHVCRILVGVVLLLTACSASAFGQGITELSRDAEGFAQVVPGRQLRFPQDLGPHPDYRIEWWYITANLEDEAGTPYGVQWTLFRRALGPGPEREGWANQQMWMAHAAITSADRHTYAETFARGGIGQAGVVATPFRAWIDSWSLRSVDLSPDAMMSRLEMTVSAPEFSYRLRLRSDVPFVLHGDQGYSRKSERGQASYYFSQPFFEVEGQLTLHGAEVKVRGRAWMDREWSSQPLAPDQKGWDWFSLHLDSGEKLMLFQFRQEDGRHYYVGSWIGAQGETQPLGPEGIAMAPVAYGEVAGRRLPLRWRLRIENRQFDVESVPLNPQSWTGNRFSYWEGPIRVTGSHQGQGYMEMTGY